MTILKRFDSPNRSFLTFICLLLVSLSFTSCSAPAMLDADNYGRNHDVFAVDFDPLNLSSISISKMDEGNWQDLGKVRNNEEARFNIEIDGKFMIVSSNSKKMDEPTYQTWLNHARQDLGMSVDDEYQIFHTIEDGWIYEIDLEEYPLLDGSSHRILMYEQK